QIGRALAQRLAVAHPNFTEGLIEVAEDRLDFAQPIDLEVDRQVNVRGHGHRANELIVDHHEEVDLGSVHAYIEERFVDDGLAAVIDAGGSVADFDDGWRLWP